MVELYDRVGDDSTLKTTIFHAVADIGDENIGHALAGWMMEGQLWSPTLDLFFEHLALIGEALPANGGFLPDPAYNLLDAYKSIIDAIKVKRDADFDALLNPVSGYTWVLRETK